LERKCFGEFRSRSIRVYNSGRIFLADLKKEFGRRDDEKTKVVELKKVEQGSRTMEEFVQEFRRVARGSRYEERPLVEEFKREMNE